DICRLIKSDPELAPIAIIHVSGRQTSQDNRAEGLDAGADGYLLKPVDPQVLVSHVRALIRLRRTEVALLQEKELRALERYTGPLQTAVASQLFSVSPL